MRIFEAAATGNVQNIEAPDPADYKYEQAVEDYENEVKNSSSSTGSQSTSLGSGQFLSAGLKDKYKSNTGYENFRKYFNDLSPNIVQDCLSTFDSQADLAMQQTIAEALYGSGRATVNINELQGILSSKGITVSTEYVSAQYRVDEFAVGGDGYVTNGAITVMTFKDANGGEIKIADANGNAALETDELFMNEILGGITTDIGNMGTAPVGGLEEEEDPLKQKMDELLKDITSHDSSKTNTNKENNDNTQETEFSEDDKQQIKAAYEYALEELEKENPEASDSELEELAENYVRTALGVSYDVSLSNIL